MRERITRLATTEDAVLLATLARETFIEAFGADNEPQHIDTYCAASFCETKQAQQIADEGLATIVSTCDESLTGYAQVRLTSPHESVRSERPSELCRLYVRSQWHGRGVAQQLMREVCDTVAHAGADVLWLGVWEENPRAIAFYKKLGFKMTGRQTFYMGDDPQRDFVLAVDLPTLARSLKPG